MIQCHLKKTIPQEWLGDPQETENMIMETNLKTPTENEKWTPKLMPKADTQNSKQAPVPHPSNTSKNQKAEHQMAAQPTKQVNGPHTANKADTEILSVHLNDMQTSMYNAKIGNTNTNTLFDSGATLSCISEQFYNKIWCLELDRIIDINAGPPLLITSASEDELINLGHCRLRFKLGQKLFEYYFQIIKNLKRDLILGLNFQRMFKISQDITDDCEVYLSCGAMLVSVMAEVYWSQRASLCRPPVPMISQ